jgi:hypothetical protein
MAAGLSASLEYPEQCCTTLAGFRNPQPDLLTPAYRQGVDAFSDLVLTVAVRFRCCGIELAAYPPNDRI